MTEQELVQEAVLTEGATARTSGRYGGYGLKHLRELAVSRSGGLTVISGTVRLEARRNDVRLQTCRRLTGTVVEVDFRPGVDVGTTGQDTF
jgi:hypothetical protein